MRRTVLAAFALFMVPTVASAVDYPIRKAGLWELTMTMTSGRTMTMSQCTDPSIDKDMIANANPSMQQVCTRSDLQKTATGYTSDPTWKVGAVTAGPPPGIGGDFNSALSVT